MIRTEDLLIDVMRSGGPGGQHQNKTESGVRITHLPTGVVVNCRDERSQHKNKAKAMRILRSRLFEQMQESHRTERDQTRRAMIGSGDRSQKIRTYNFPQNRVTDHRIGLTLYNLNQVIQGDLLALTKALIEHDRREQLGDLVNDRTARPKSRLGDTNGVRSAFSRDERTPATHVASPARRHGPRILGRSAGC